MMFKCMLTRYLLPIRQINTSHLSNFVSTIFPRNLVFKED